MFTEAKGTEIYCMADDFCKEFALQQGKYMFEDTTHTHQNKPNRMNDAEIMIILILFHSEDSDISSILQGICLQAFNTST